MHRTHFIKNRAFLPWSRALICGALLSIAACSPDLASQDTGPQESRSQDIDAPRAGGTENVDPSDSATAETSGADAQNGADGRSDPAATGDIAPPRRSYGVKLYALDCGTIGVSDLDIFSDGGDYAGQQDTFADTCFLIRHPDGDLIWDFGLPEALAGAEPVTNGPFTLSLTRTIEAQLAEIDLAPADIEFAAISHSHFDHVSQLAGFAEATFIVHPDELDHMSLAAAADADMAAVLDVVTRMAKHYVAGQEFDVFADGSVVLFATPGHTPGHMSLQVILDDAGPLLLTGDLYHRKESRALQRVPRFNSDAGATRVSMQAFETRAQLLGARVIIQHEPDDIATLPVFPEALE